MRLSIIVPTLNEESVLEKMLYSLRKLTILEYEIIVSDGGSTDNTLEIANRLADKVVTNSSGARQNIAIGRNAGAAEASGEYFVFMDADVFIPNMDEFFAQAITHFLEHRACAGYIVYLQVLPEHRTWQDVLFHSFYNRWLFFMNMIVRSPVSQGEFQMMPAALFRKVGGYDERLTASEDMELFMRLGKHGGIHVASQSTAYHTGRRAHTVGWLRLLAIWSVNGFTVKFFNRSVSKEWAVIR